MTDSPNTCKKEERGVKKENTTKEGQELCSQFVPA